MPVVSRPTAPRIAVVGATGALGLTILDLIEERGLPYRELQLVASSRSSGRELEVGPARWPVHALDDFGFGSTDLAFFCAGAAVSRAWAPVAAGRGAAVVDSSMAFSEDSGIPLIVPQLNAREMDDRSTSGVVASPGPMTVLLTRVLEGLDERWGLRRIVVSTYQGASGLGHAGVEALQEATRTALQDPHAAALPGAFTPPLAFNVVPQTGPFTDSGFTLDEDLMAHESRRVLGLPALELSATCVRVPVVSGCAQSVWVECREPVDRTRLLARLRSLPGVLLYEDAEDGLPTPITHQDTDQIHVGRVRISSVSPSAFWLWLVADDLRAGAALNAVRIAEELMDRRLA